MISALVVEKSTAVVTSPAVRIPMTSTAVTPTATYFLTDDLGAAGCRKWKSTGHNYCYWTRLLCDRIMYNPASVGTGIRQYDVLGADPIDQIARSTLHLARHCMHLIAQHDLGGAVRDLAAEL